MATRQLMAFGAPPGPRQPRLVATWRESSARLAWGKAAMSWRIASSSAAVKSRPQ
jgi:hypothetical protein